MALENLKLEWNQIKDKGTLTIYKGNIKHEHLYNRVKLRRILSNKVMRLQQAKFLEMLLKAGNTGNIPEKLDLKDK
jgi:hypothetical protein